MAWYHRALVLPLVMGASAHDLRGTLERDLQASTLQITSLILVDSTNDVAVVDLVANEGAAIYLDEINVVKPTFNINATFRGTTVKSIRFRTNIPNRRIVTENTASFALCGNTGANFRECPTLVPGGNYTISATPFARQRAQGTAGPTVDVSFAILYTRNKFNYTLKNLSYAYDALEPYIDTTTMNLHHTKHHGGAVTSLNKATENVTNKLPLVNLMENALNATAIRNNGGSHYNHALFWESMSPFDQANLTRPSLQLSILLNNSFGSLDTMKTQFNAAAAPGTLFGSGWVWLCVNNAGDRLEIIGTPNQDNPLMRGVSKEIMFPILGLDVWEHAYYLKHQNVRANYVTNWWWVVDWDKVSNNCAYVVANKSGVNVEAA